MLGSCYVSQGECDEWNTQIWGVISNMKLEFFLFVKKKKSNLISKNIQFFKLSEKPCKTEALLTLRNRVRNNYL